MAKTTKIAGKVRHVWHIAKSEMSDVCIFWLGCYSHSMKSGVKLETREMSGEQQEVMDQISICSPAAICSLQDTKDVRTQSVTPFRIFTEVYLLSE